ncbi:MAG: transcriptional regulator [Bacteroidota bacterium]|nr:transcriptional regulator [Bacteroidota bacterium]
MRGVTMDSLKLTKELWKNMHDLKNSDPIKNMFSSMQGSTLVLHYLLKNNCVAFPNEISKYMSISTARIAATLRNLEKKGYITREIDVNDRRQVIVTLTPLGKEVVEKNCQKMLDISRQTLESLGEHDAKELVRIFGKMADHWNQHK